MGESAFDLEALTGVAEAARRSVEPITVALQWGSSPVAYTAALTAAAKAIEAGTGGAVACSEEFVGDDAPVGLAVRVGTREVARYLAVPTGPEAGPFLDLLRLLADPPASLTHGERGPALLEVFIAAGCPNCPRAVAAATGLAASRRRLVAEIIDVEVFPRRASVYSVRSVPTTVADGGLTLVGVVSREMLEARLGVLRRPDGEGEVFRSLVEAGRFDDAATSLRGGAAAGVFSEMWNASSMEGRIGLLIAAETALDEDPRCLDALVSLLAPALAGGDRARRGDTADLLGRIGHSAAIPLLEACLHDDDPEVAEAAADALDAVRVQRD